MTNYLDQFPAEFHEFIKNKFRSAYVFPEETYEFGEEDTIQLAKGPREMKTRLTTNLQKLLTLGPTPEQVQVIEQVLPTVDSSDEFLKQIKQEIDAIWAASKDYQVNHPKKEKKKPFPPSEKQLTYLKSLGCPEVPTSKSAATKLIDQWKHRRN